MIKLEQLSHFNFLGCNISYKYDNDKNKRLKGYQMMCGIMQKNTGK